tara:strand:- start:109 stop:825 length:717 start_codon:yes stop_codon:yes gene_type:complete
MDKKDYIKKFAWPMAKDIVSAPGGMYKKDDFLEKINQLILNKKAACPISGGTRRTEPIKRVKNWVKEQNDHLKKVSSIVTSNRIPNLDKAHFPHSDTGTDTLTITTSKTQLFLIDKPQDFIDCFNQVFGINDEIKSLIGNKPLLLFEIDSLESGGRAFSGDPFTGQIAAFSKVYCCNLENNQDKTFILYYPHQIYSQLFNRSGKIKQNKGTKVISANVNLVITNNGIVLDPKTWRVLN